MLEAMACGRPVIACPPPYGRYDPLRDGETGVCAKVDDAEDLALQIKRVLVDGDLSSRIGMAARRLMVDEYDWPAIAKKIVTFYWKVASSRLERPSSWQSF